MSTPRTVLIFGNARDLIQTRQMVLEYAGFDVDVASSLQQVTDLLTSRPFDLFILCHSLSPHDCEEGLSRAHSLRPGMKNLILSSVFSECKGGPQDVSLGAFIDPKTLIATVTELKGFAAAVPGKA